jgi:hypothetical protein
MGYHLGFYEHAPLQRLERQLALGRALAGMTRKPTSTDPSTFAAALDLPSCRRLSFEQALELGGSEQQRAELLFQQLGDAGLLLLAAVHLEREDHGRLRRDESCLSHRLGDRRERDLGDQRVAMRHHRLATAAVPAVDLQRAAALQ